MDDCRDAQITEGSNKPPVQNRVKCELVDQIPGSYRYVYAVRQSLRSAKLRHIILKFTVPHVLSQIALYSWFAVRSPKVRISDCIDKILIPCSNPCFQLTLKISNTSVLPDPRSVNL